MQKRFFLALIVLSSFWHAYAYGTSAPLNKIDYMYPPLKTSLPPIVGGSATPAPVQPSAVDFGVCTKFFKMDSQKLFYLTLAGINANRFEIIEIQSQSGYVIFSAAQKQFLAKIITVDPKNSMLKITPCSNAYFFPVGIVQNMFKYIELYAATPIEKLSVL